LRRHPNHQQAQRSECHEQEQAMNRAGERHMCLSYLKPETKLAPRAPRRAKCSIKNLESFGRPKINSLVPWRFDPAIAGNQPLRRALH
jgi:hypothetical protein